ncbi:hypothetical protein KIW84_070122 [Lathyrus oleraceus]|uniref:Uncharacterized protein n=1 Tax=Pisum sativum TaxID=3888 RepID=A0A9D4VFT1_PEA|nr:hypothetical protein KIW84_070122 [Pisum sativum]
MVRGRTKKAATTPMEVTMVSPPSTSRLNMINTNMKEARMHIETPNQPSTTTKAESTIQEQLEEHKEQIEANPLVDIIKGDFNNVINVVNRIGGEDIQTAELSDLEEMVEEIGMHEHDTRGSHFTLSNKHTSGMIYSITNKVVCNKDWFIAFPKCDIEVLQPHISDHSPR